MKVGPLTEIGDFWRFIRDLLSKTLQNPSILVFLTV